MFYNLIKKCLVLNSCITILKAFLDLILVGIVDSKKQVYSSWLKILPYGYPIPTLNRDKILNEKHKIFSNLDIYSRGR